MSFRCNDCGNTFADADHDCYGRTRGKAFTEISGGSSWNPFHSHRWEPLRWHDASVRKNQYECKCGATRVDTGGADP
jgi:hypothetical protein